MPLKALAGRVGAQDLFVLHRVAGARLVNLDGEGRGAGWAGNVTMESGAEPWLHQVPEARIVRAKSGVPQRMFGPYWAAEAVAVAVGDDIVVFGGEGVTEHPDALLGEVAERAAVYVAEVPVAKRLADELEVSQAALAIATMRPPDLETAATEIATKAAQALSCEFGAVLLHGRPPRLFLSREGWRPPADDEEIIAALLPLREGVQGEILVEQDLSCSPFPYHPLAFEDGLIARAATPLGPEGSMGLLVVAHAAGAPRGFTSLCQRVIITIARTAEPLLEAAIDGEAEALANAAER